MNLNLNYQVCVGSLLHLADLGGGKEVADLGGEGKAGPGDDEERCEGGGGDEGEGEGGGGGEEGDRQEGGER